MRSLSQQELSDRIEINDLLIRYTVAIDTKDWDLMRSVLAPNARSVYSDGKYAYEGRDAIVEEGLHLCGAAPPALPLARRLLRRRRAHVLGWVAFTSALHGTVFLLAGTDVAAAAAAAAMAARLSASSDTPSD